MKNYALSVLLLSTAFTNAALAQATPASESKSDYKIETETISTTDYTACAILQDYRVIEQKEKDPGLTPAQKDGVEFAKGEVKASLKETPLNLLAATVTIRFDLPAKFQLNRDLFFLNGVEQQLVTSFESSLIRGADSKGVVEIPGSGTGTVLIKMSVAAFCPLYTENNTKPSIASVLQTLIK